MPITVKGPLTQSSHSTPQKGIKGHVFTVTCKQVFPFEYHPCSFILNFVIPHTVPKSHPFLYFLKYLSTPISTVLVLTHDFSLGFFEASSPLFSNSCFASLIHLLYCHQAVLSFYLHSPALRWYVEGTQQLFVKWLDEAEHSVLYASYTRYICLVALSYVSCFNWEII